MRPLSPDPQSIAIASGENFPDALSGSVLTGLNGGSISLVSPDAGLTPATLTFMQSHKGKPIISYGGTGVISDAIFQQAKGVVGK